MRNSAAWTGFLLVCFVLVGLTGLFATYATTIPLERALNRGAALDRALALSRQPGAAAELAALRPLLGPGGDAVLAGDGPIEDRVAAARAAAVAEQRRDSANIAYRLRLLICVVTLVAAALGAGIMRLAGRS